jgi:peptide/nickel transport system substrate-binding protein
VVNASDKTGGTLKLASASDCYSYDPARTFDYYCWDLQRLFTRTLMGFASAPGIKGTSVVPDMATGPGEFNADRTQWTYHLRPGLKYSDGADITTKDIKYAVERLFAVDVIDGGLSAYYTSLLSDTYEGPYADPTGDLTSVATPDDSTIIFNLNRPFADFDYLMALPTAGPVPKVKDTKADYGKFPISSGPFMISSYQPGKETVWVRNPNWNQATDKIRSPKVDKVTLVVIGDLTDEDKRLMSGEVDLLADAGVTPQTTAAILADPTKKVNADNPTTGFIRYDVVFQTVAPLDNKACREAVFYAFNKAELRSIFGPETTVDIASSMVPPLIPGYEAGFNPYPVGADSTGNLVMAKQKLAECGQPNGFDLNYAYLDSGLGRKGLASVSVNLGRVGIKVHGVASNDPASYYLTFIGSPSNVKKMKLGMASVGWGADTATATGFWQSIAKGDSIMPEGNANYPSLEDATVDQSLDALAMETDPTKVADLGRTISHAVMDSAVYLPFALDKMFFYRNPRLTNIYLNGGVGNYYDYVNIGTSDGM